MNKTILIIAILTAISLHVANRFRFEKIKRISQTVIKKTK